MVDANGEVFEFNVFTATLGYSRLHKFTYSPTRTTDDLLACLLGAFRFMGGVPQECLTDNMAAVVSASSGRREKNGRVSRFAREAGFELQLCRTRTPQTKGKDESANRSLSRLLAYDGDFVGLEGLLEAIARIESRSNSEPNETTGLPPAALFLREKGAPAADRQRRAARVDGRRRHRAGRAPDDAGQGGGQAVVGAPRVHRQEGQGGVDAGRADTGHRGG